MKMQRPQYFVYTWDPMKQTFTPQKGVRCGPYSLFGLRKALRKLRGMGYQMNGPSVYVARAELFLGEKRRLC